MNIVQDALSPKLIATEAFTDASAAVGRLQEIYARNTGLLRHHLEAYARGEPLNSRVRATYRFVRITTTSHSRLDSRLSYGFVSGPGTHQTTVTRPDLFRAYLTEQIGLLIQNHGVAVEIGESDEPIPIHFAYPQDINPGLISTPAIDRCAISSTRRISRKWMTASSMARCRRRPGRRPRFPCSARLASIIHCTDFTTIRAPIPSTSRIS